MQTGLNQSEVKKEINVEQIKNLDGFLDQLKNHHDILANLKHILNANFNPYDSVKIYLNFI